MDTALREDEKEEDRNEKWMLRITKMMIEEGEQR